MLRYLALGMAGAHVIADVLGSRERARRLRRAILISPPLFPFAFGRLRASVPRSVLSASSAPSEPHVFVAVRLPCSDARMHRPRRVVLLSTSSSSILCQKCLHVHACMTAYVHRAHMQIIERTIVAVLAVAEVLLALRLDGVRVGRGVLDDRPGVQKRLGLVGARLLAVLDVRVDPVAAALDLGQVGLRRLLLLDGGLLQLLLPLELQLRRAELLVEPGQLLAG